MIEAIAGVPLGYARAHYGRCYHVVDVEQVRVRVGQSADGTPTMEMRPKVTSAICGFEPQQWNAPAQYEGVQANVHAACRAALKLRADAEAGRVDHVIR